MIDDHHGIVNSLFKGLDTLPVMIVADTVPEHETSLTLHTTPACATHNAVKKLVLRQQPASQAHLLDDVSGTP